MTICIPYIPYSTSITSLIMQSIMTSSVNNSALYMVCMTSSVNYVIVMPDSIPVPNAYRTGSPELAYELTNRLAQSATAAALILEQLHHFHCCDHDHWSWLWIFLHSFSEVGCSTDVSFTDHSSTMLFG